MASYSAINPNQHQQQPYSQPGYNESSGFITPMPANGRKKGASKWLKFGLPILLIIVIVGAVLGGVLGSRASKKNSQESDEATASGAASVKNEVGVYPTSTNSEFMVPIYPSTVSQVKSVIRPRKSQQPHVYASHRLTLPLTATPPSTHLLPTTSPGPVIHTSSLTHPLLQFAQSALVLSRLPTSGRH